MMSAPPLKQPHILVVDDSAGVRAALERLLAPYCQVTLAEGVQEALAALNPPADQPDTDQPGTDQVDMVLSDIQMPDENGFDLARCLRQSHPDLPVVLATGVNEPAIRTEAHALGIQDVLRKPLTPQNLFPVLEKHLGQKLATGREINGEETAETPLCEIAQSDLAVQIDLAAQPELAQSEATLPEGTEAQIQPVPGITKQDLLDEVGAIPGVLSAAQFDQDGGCLRFVNLPFPAAMGQALGHLMVGAVNCQQQLGTRLEALSHVVQVEFADRILIITPYQEGHLTALVRDVTAAIAVKGHLRNTALNTPEP